VTTTSVSEAGATSRRGTLIAAQPAWARPAIWAIAAFAAVMFGWQALRTGVNPLYASAARSMTESWHAFFYNAIDPAGSITIDKLGGFIWPQAISARIFGYHTWSLALPEAIEGVITVVVLFRLVRRWAGPAAGIVAAALFTLTPVIASVFGHSGMEDNALTMCLVLAASTWQKAIAGERLRPLLVAGFWVGVAFQTKMAEAWAVLPAFAVTYLIAAPPRLRKRVGYVLAAGVVAAVVSLSWITAIQLTPAGDRPYVDGSTNNNAFSMALGYNALGRFRSLGIDSSGTGSVAGFGGGSHRGGATGRAPGGFAGPAGAGTAGRGTAGWGTAGAGTGTARGGPPGGPPGGGTGGANGWGKLLSASGFASQIGWLYPLAALALLFGIVSRRRRGRADTERAGYIMWGLWLAVFGFAFSAGQVPHSHYTAVLAPGIAALAGAGIVTFVRRYRAGGRAAWLLPVAVAATAAWSVYLSSQYSGFLPWLRLAVAVLGLAGCGILAFGLLTRRAVSRIAAVGVAAGVLAMVATPAAWAVSVFDSNYDGNGINASAGPAGGMGSGGGGARGGRFPGLGNRAGTALSASGEARLQEILGRLGRGRGGFGGAGGLPGGGPGGGLQLTASQKRLISYLSAHRDGAKYLLAVPGSTAAATEIAATGDSILPMGGFTGSVPFPTLAQFEKLVSTGQLHYVMNGAGSTFGGMFGTMMGSGSGGTASAISSWVTDHCTSVPASAYGGSAQTAGYGAAAAGGRPAGAGTTGTGSAAQAGPTGTAAGSLYHCG
jgi:4-amino-4-deoxy-L-arabinose transferase-like glycosyltransferase